MLGMQDYGRQAMQEMKLSDVGLKEEAAAAVKKQRS